MGYKMPIVCKELYLPVPYVSMTIKQYKEAYGIDLTPWIKLEDGNIRLIFPKNTKVYVVLPQVYDEYLCSTIELAHVVSLTTYVEGSDNAVIHLGYTDINTDTFGLEFIISKDAEFSLENLRIGSAW